MSAAYDRLLSQFTDYRSITTLWDDYSIADEYGVDAIEKTFNRTFHDWKDNYKYLTEMVMVLNHKVWQWHEQTKTNQHFQAYVDLYQTLWEKAEKYAEDHLQGEELSYFYRITD